MATTKIGVDVVKSQYHKKYLSTAACNDKMGKSNQAKQVLLS